MVWYWKRYKFSREVRLVLGGKVTYRVVHSEAFPQTKGNATGGTLVVGVLSDPLPYITNMTS